ncbi:MAG: class I SAM-dependent methyltransferase [Pseudomonadota bacterium]
MSGQTIRTEARTRCKICGGPGDVRYKELRDRLYDVPGDWSFRACKNPDCGAFWLDPEPIEEDLSLLYADYVTHEDSDAKEGNRDLREFIKRAYWRSRFGYDGPPALIASVLALAIQASRRLRDQFDAEVFWLPAASGGAILDVGCGAGYQMQRMASLGWDVSGVDFDEAAVANARSRGLDVKLGSVSDQGFPENHFDAVVMSHVIEHVPDPRAVIAECHRILKPGGRFVCSTPNARSDGHRKFAQSWFSLDPPRHLCLFSAEALGAAARDLSWSSLRVIESDANSMGVYVASRRIVAAGKNDMNHAPARMEIMKERLARLIGSIRRQLRPMTPEEIVLYGVKN